MMRRLHIATVYATPGNTAAEIPSVKEIDAAFSNRVIADVTSSVICGTLRAAADLTQAAKGVMLAMLRGQNEVSGAILHRISHTSGVAVRETAAGGGDFESVATGLVAGAIERATTMGVNREEAAAAAADGALRAANIAGSHAFEAVEKAVTRSIDGVQVVMKKPTCNQQITNRARSY